MPTTRKATLQSALAIVSIESWKTETVYVKWAFLQGNKIEQEVNLEPPEDAKIEGKIWPMRKSAYGLCDAACSWHLSLKGELLKLGCKQSEIDKAAFMWYKNNLAGAFIIHVDDILMPGATSFRQEVIEN